MRRLDLTRYVGLAIVVLMAAVVLMRPPLPYALRPTPPDYVAGVAVVAVIVLVYRRFRVDRRASLKRAYRRVNDRLN